MNCYFNIAAIMVQDTGSIRLNMLQDQIEQSQILAYSLTYQRVTWGKYLISETVYNL